MGANGRQRVRTIYDWKNIVFAYETLWENLTEQRIAAQMVAPVKSGTPSHPLCDDPFRQFAHYPSTMLTDDLIVQISSQFTPELLTAIGQDNISNFGKDRRLSLEDIAKILQELTEQGSQSIGEIINSYRDLSPIRVITTLGYLLKFNIISIQPNL